MSSEAIAAVYMTLKVASLATLISMILGVALGFVFSRRSGPIARLSYAILSLPMVLPPTAVGYLLLKSLANSREQAATLFGMELDWLLTWQAAVIAATVMAFPIVLRTARAAFEAVDQDYEAVARTLGDGPVATFRRVTLPMAKRGLTAAAVLGFTRAASEFGATVTIAGNIPFKTQTLASAIYSAQQIGRSDDVALLIGAALAIGIAALVISEWLVRQPNTLLR